jgi:hypothetical protein
VVLALNAWAQVLLRLFHFSDDPPLLVAMQLVVGAAAALTVWGTWRSTRWASLAALAYGVFGAALLASLAPLLLLPPDARGGLWTGAAVVLLFGLWSAWYLRPRVE